MNKQKIILTVFITSTLTLSAVLVMSSLTIISKVKLEKQIIPDSIDINVVEQPNVDYDMNEWRDITVCAYIGNQDKQDISISYPAELDLNGEHSNEVCLAPEIEEPNLFLGSSKNPEVVAASLTTDLKYIFYLKKTLENNITTYRLKKADINSRSTELIDQKSFLSEDVQNLNFDSLLMPHIFGNYLAYNWFSDKINLRFVNNEEAALTGKVKSLSTNQTIYTSPCDNLFRLFPSTFSISEDGKHIVLACNGMMYLSDWQTTDRISLPTKTVVKEIPAHRVFFKDNDTIGFVDEEDENALRAPIYTVDLNGDNLEKVGDVYLGF